MALGLLETFCFKWSVFLEEIELVSILEDAIILFNLFPILE